MIDLNETQVLELKERFKKVRIDIERIHELLMIGGIERNCYRCLNFVTDKRNETNSDKKYCLIWKSEPPEHIRDKGCEHFEYDDIPF